MSFRVEEDGVFAGAVRLLNALLNPGCVSDTHVAADADITATKLEHQHRAVYEQESDTTSAAETRVVHVVHGATGTLKAFKAGSITVCTSDATITVDLLKNGVSVLSAAIVLDSGNSVRVVEAGTISGPSVVAGDVLEVDVAVSAGGGTIGKGAFAFLDLHEDAA